MSRQVALLRGINVQGLRIAMRDLVKVMEDLGHTEVRTILATGNVIFTPAPGAPPLHETLAAGLGKAFGYDAQLTLVSVEQLAAVVDAYPFDSADPSKQPYVIFALNDTVLDELVEGLTLDPEIDRIQRGDGVIYWEVLVGLTTKSAIGRRIAKYSTITTRNLRTVAKVVAAERDE